MRHDNKVLKQISDTHCCRCTRWEQYFPIKWFIKKYLYQCQVWLLYCVFNVLHSTAWSLGKANVVTYTTNLLKEEVKFHWNLALENITVLWQLQQLWLMIFFIHRWWYDTDLSRYLQSIGHNHPWCTSIEGSL